MQPSQHSSDMTEGSIYTSDGVMKMKCLFVGNPNYENRPARYYKGQVVEVIFKITFSEMGSSWETLQYFGDGVLVDNVRNKTISQFGMVFFSELLWVLFVRYCKLKLTASSAQELATTQVFCLVVLSTIPNMHHSY